MLAMRKAALAAAAQAKPVALVPACPRANPQAAHTVAAARRVPSPSCAAAAGLASSSRRASGGQQLCRAQAPAVETEKPMPVVRMDNHTDPFATIVSIEYGDRLGELLETITALKNLDLNIRRAKLSKDGGSNVNTYFITESSTSEKVLKSSRLEEIRMVVLNSLVSTFPESGAMLGGATTSSTPTKWLGQRTVIPTTIQIEDAPNGFASLLKIKTQDRPGLLVDIVRVLKDINLNVVSAEVDTIGSQALDEFYVTYHGEPLSSPMELLATNALQYYLSLGELANDESY